MKESSWQKEEAVDLFETSIKSTTSMQSLVYNTYFHRVCSSYVRPNQKVLDLGCGPGLTSQYLHDHGCQVVACDISREMLRRVDINKGNRTIETRLGSAFDLPAVAGEFDAVVSRMCIPHFPNWPDILHEVSRVLNRGGYFIYSFNNSEHYRRAKALYRVDREALGVTDERRYPEYYYAHVSCRKLKGIAASAGLTVSRIIPVNLFSDNAIYCGALGRDKYLEMRKSLDNMLKRESVRDFILWFEENVVSHLPPDETYSNITILRKG